MGLLDSLAAQVLGSGSGAGPQGGLLEAIGGLLNQQPGGLAGLISAFERGGLGEVAASWVGSGANLPISADQLQSVLGSGAIESLARSAGFAPQEASAQLAQWLPQVVDKLTPQGTMPDAGSLAAMLGSPRL